MAFLLLLPPTANAIDIRYIAFGDSITAGFTFDEACGCQAPACQQVCGYPRRLEGLFAGINIDARVFNRGEGGERTPTGLERLDVVLAELPGADIVLLMEGSNDISRDIPPEATLFNLNQMAQRVVAAGMEPVFATVIPRIPEADKDPENVTTNFLVAGIRDLAFTTDRRIADPFTSFSAVPALFDTHYADRTMGDPVGHPNARGFDLLAQTFFDALTGGNDTVAPGLGRVSPANGSIDVNPFSPITVRVYDFGIGIDRSFSALFVNGEEVPVTETGGGSWHELEHVPSTPLPEDVSVRFRARDFNLNTMDQQISSFTVDAAAPGPCVADNTTLCIDDRLGDRRFQVTLSFETVAGGGAEGDAEPINLAPIGLRRGGLFSFFDTANPEVLVKVLNGCNINDRFWLFVAPTTTVGYEMRVVDTVAAQAGAPRSDYEIVITNEDGQDAPPFGSTSAFPTCSFVAGS